MLPLALVLAGWIAMTANVEAAPDWHAMVETSGAVQLTYNGREVARVEPGLFEAGWRGGSLLPGGQVSAVAGTVRGRMSAPSGKTVAVELRAGEADGRLRLAYALAPQAEMTLNSLHVELNVPTRLVAGRSLTADGQAVPVPPEFEGTTHLRNEPTRTVRLPIGDETALELTLEEPGPVLLQDNRQWGPSLSVRIGPQMDAETPWPAGRTLDVALELRAPEPIALEFDEPVVMRAGEDWIPLSVELDVRPGSALDLTNLVERDLPAGSKGALIVRPDGRFAFEAEPDRARRFYGVNLCFSAHYISHEQSDRLAERLMRLGYNTLRFHHYEGELVEQSAGTTTTFRPDRLDQLDYLFAALKKRGIYVTTDLFVSRPVRAGEIWPGAEGRVDNFKMLVPVNQQAFENWKQFSANLLTHVNPYTGLSYARDPALAWISLINEGNPANYIRGVQGRAAEDWRRAWNRFLAERYATPEELRQAWGDEPGGDPRRGTVPLHRDPWGEGPRSSDFAEFLAATQLDFFRRARSFLREELGCRALLTNLNGWSQTVQDQAVRADFDYVDDHFYVYHPHFVERSWSLPSRIDNVDPISQGARGGRSGSFVRLLDRPYTVSEYNYAYPGRYRGQGGLITGSLAALQDWDVIWRFTYSHNRNNLFEQRGAGYFDLAADPLNQAADRAALFVFLRGDIEPAPHAVAVAATRDELLRNSQRGMGVAPPWHELAWVTRVGTFVPHEGAPVPADLVLPIGWGGPTPRVPAGRTLELDPYERGTGDVLLEAMRRAGWLGDNATDLDAGRFQSETGQVLVDSQSRTLTVRTPQTAGGCAPAGGAIDAGPVHVSIEEAAATVWVSSVDGEPIEQSSRLLITHLTDLQNTGSRFAEKTRRTLQEYGGPPHLVRAGAATVRLRVRQPERARVWSLATSGRRMAPVEASVEDGRLVVPLDVRGPRGARMLYEVEIP
jgi:hypothetical protein